MKTKLVGRPKGKIKTAKIEIAIEPQIKAAFMESLHKNNQYASVVLRDWILDYIKKQGVEIK
ncbi:hypothetical protein V6B14_21235 [Sporosarcina psychrophila]|uniref:hypothetical protein n=1 Tax=Sporosarcina psychrophila TaxID=1476 RepID=UPI0030D3086E